MQATRPSAGASNVLDTLGRYFANSESRKPVFAAVAIAGPRLGQMLTWSVSRKAANDGIAAQWDPENWLVVKVSAVSKAADRG